MYFTSSKRLTLAGAKKMMDTATGKAEKAGYAVAVAIVDAGGHPVLVQRMDGGRFHTVHSSTTKAVCAACPVKELCLEFALETREAEGIWGGTTARERRRLLRQRRKNAAA